MGKKAKVAAGLGICCALLLAAAVGVAEWQLRPAQLTPRVNSLLRDAGLGGSVAEAGAELGGSFRLAGIDLTLPDGTRLQAESLVGEAEILPLLGGKVRLASLEAKGLVLKLAPAGAPAAAAAPPGKGIEEDKWAFGSIRTSLP